LPEMADKFSFDLRQIIKKKKKIECDAWCEWLVEMVQ
jgi:hypothetical protein